jgi:hypothetical protein
MHWSLAACRQDFCEECASQGGEDPGVLPSEGDVHRPGQEGGGHRQGVDCSGEGGSSEDGAVLWSFGPARKGTFCLVFLSILCVLEPDSGAGQEGTLHVPAHRANKIEPTGYSPS